jgi:transcriptional regulator with XRE-family HTH domain
MDDTQKERKEQGMFIRFMRLSAGMTIEQFAKEMGCNENTISRYEKAHRSPEDWYIFELRVREVVKKALDEKRRNVCPCCGGKLNGSIKGKP